jgi:hypothetical protein
VARAILLAATAVWSIAAAAAVGIAVIGIDRLLAILPPLAIDADAVRGAVVALGVGAGVAASAHGVLVVALGGNDPVRRRIAATVAMLLGGVLSATFVGLAAAAMASAVARPEVGGVLWPGAAAALVAAAAYATVIISLVGERRSRTAGRPR